MGSGGVAQTGGGWDHGCRSFVDGVDDLGVVDPAQVGGCDPEVSMTELPLDDYQRDAFAGHPDCVRVAELVRREPTAHPAVRAALRSWTRIPDGEQGRPQVGPRSTQKSTPTGSPA